MSSNRRPQDHRLDAADIDRAQAVSIADVASDVMGAGS